MTTDAPKDPVVPKRRETAPEPEEGADHGVSPEGVAYQAPSRPFAEQDEPGQPPEVDPELDEKRQAQADEAAARYK
jgi:hypothetical protein